MGVRGVTGAGLWAGSSASCSLVPASLMAHGSWSGICMVLEGKERQVFVGLLS